MSIPCTFEKETLEPSLKGQNDVAIPSVSEPSASSQSSGNGYISIFWKQFYFIPVYALHMYFNVAIEIIAHYPICG